MTLSDVSTIRSGLVLSRKLARKGEPVAQSYPLLTLRSINEKGFIDTAQLDPYPATEVLSPDYLTRCGDIVLRLSTPYTAVLIDCSTENLVISSNFVVIRVDPQRIDPQYLVWLLNTPRVKRQIYANTTKNMLSSINAAYFATIELKPLSLAEQKQLSALHQRAQQETALLRQLADQKEVYYNALLDKLYHQL